MKATLSSYSALAVLLAAAHAPAAITGTFGQVTQIGAPPSAVLGALTGFNAFAWDEQQNVALPATFFDETTNPGGSATPLPGIVPAGAYDSHFLHFENVPGVIAASGQVTFSQPIVAAAFVNTTLDATDASLGAFGTVYPTTYPLRGLNSPSSFFFIGNTLTFQFVQFFPTNFVVQVRVITHAVPAPGAAALLGLGGAACLRRRRR
jgi:hypothetical protein